MGYEYTIKCSVGDPSELRDLLKSLPHYERTDRQGERNQAYLYRRADNDGQLPNALIEIISEGLYFCDYGGGEEILKELLFRLALGGGAIELIDQND